MKTYEKYKNSGVAWLEKIPEHWKVIKLRRVCTSIITGKTPPGANEKYYSEVGLSWFTPSDIGENMHVNKAKKFLSVQGEKFVNFVPKHSILMMGIGDVGKVSITDIDCSTNQQINAIICDDRFMNNCFLAYYLTAIREHIFNTAKFVTLRIFNQEETKNIFVPVPPLSEQEAIVKFLDYKISRIEKLISIRQRQIVELKELKKAVINKAVTKGDWKRVRLKNLVKLINEKTSSPNLKYIGMENIESWTGRLIETEEIIPESVSNKFYKGDILFGKLRPYLAKVFLAPSDGICSSEFLVLRSKEIKAEFLQYYLISYKFIDIVNSSTYGAKMPRANWQFIGNCLIPVPAIAEQNEIAEYLDKKCTQIDKLITIRKKQITELNELKARLISDAVTGKIDVR